LKFLLNSSSRSLFDSLLLSLSLSFFFFFFFFSQSPQRENHECKDIEGTQPGWRPHHQRVRLEAAPSNAEFDVRDINNVGFKSTRVVDPLKPEYRVNGMVIRDDPKYTQPRPLPAPATHDFFSLKTNDIEGAWPGWVPPHECTPPMDQRRHFRNTNFVGDIRGAKADTVKHSIVTERVVNPLNPVYDSLDGDRLRPPLTPNILNGDPAKFGLHQPDSFKDRRSSSSSSNQQPPPQQQIHQSMVVEHPQQLNSARSQQQLSARMVESARGGPSSARSSGVHGGSVPGINLSAVRSSSAGEVVGGGGTSAKDHEIARLERELNSLKATYSGGGGAGSSARQQQQQQQSGRVGPVVKSSARDSSSYGASARGGGGASAREGGGGGFGVTQQATSARMGSSSTAAFVSSARASARGGGGGSVSNSARASARKSAALAAEIASVREL
jgi:hypothetical protein